MSIYESTRSKGHVWNLPWATPGVVDDIPMTESAGPTATPYGSWPSPITAVDVAKGQVLISYPIVIGDDVWWQEGRPDEGGRGTGGDSRPGAGAVDDGAWGGGGVRGGGPTDAALWLWSAGRGWGNLSRAGLGGEPAN